ncbi:MAG: very short patch repair endonuclease [Candidatus Odinarchaeota archaeon]
MTDIYSKVKRSEVMSKITSKNTKPEKFVRSLLHRLGFRFRIHSSNLPGKPDIVLKKYNTIIFVHGCFWHGHSCTKGNTRPKSNKTFWNKKIEDNMERDKRKKAELIKLGWNVVEVWECEIKEKEKLALRLLKILQS